MNKLNFENKEDLIDNINIEEKYLLTAKNVNDFKNALNESINELNIQNSDIQYLVKTFDSLSGEQYNIFKEWQNVLENIKNYPKFSEISGHLELFETLINENTEKILKIDKIIGNISLKHSTFILDLSHLKNNFQIINYKFSEFLVFFEKERKSILSLLLNIQNLMNMLKQKIKITLGKSSLFDEVFEKIKLCKFKIEDIKIRSQSSFNENESLMNEEEKNSILKKINDLNLDIEKDDSLNELISFSNDGFKQLEDIKNEIKNINYNNKKIENN